MSWHFLQEQEVASWEADSLDGAPSALLSVLPTLAAFCCSGRPTGISTDSRSGMTSELSMGTRGAGQLTSLPAGSPVRTSAQQATAQGSTAPAAASGWKWPGSFARFDRDSSLWKIRQCSFLGVSDEFSETWPRWGSMRDGECSELSTPARIMSERGSGLWPTPNKMDGHNAASMNDPIHWRSRFEKKAAEGISLQFPLRVAVHCPSPRTPPSAWDGGLLNPDWTEWLMGWPIGWTDCTPLETDRFRQWLRLHGI